LAKSRYPQDSKVASDLTLHSAPAGTDEIAAAALVGEVLKLSLKAQLGKSDMLHVFVEMYKCRERKCEAGSHKCTVANTGQVQYCTSGTKRETGGAMQEAGCANRGLGVTWVLVWLLCTLASRLFTLVEREIEGVLSLRPDWA